MGLEAFYFIIFALKTRISCEGSSENHFISILDHLCFISVKTIIYEHRWQLDRRKGSRAWRQKFRFSSRTFAWYFPHPLRAQSENFKMKQNFHKYIQIWSKANPTIVLKIYELQHAGLRMNYFRYKNVLPFKIIWRFFITKECHKKIGKNNINTKFSPAQGKKESLFSQTFQKKSSWNVKTSRPRNAKTSCTPIQHHITTYLSSYTKSADSELK